MPRFLCIHGHFYQPPREDPWLGDTLPEDSAAPATNWNHRITRESYAPLAWARRQDHQGRIADILNCYAWISFNVGPTLLRRLAYSSPETYQRILDADKESVSRWGHGNAIAQAYHHTILPLAKPRDKKLEIAWALNDFSARFGREAEGMWLAESATDTATLEELASQGVRFVILAPRQAKAVAKIGESNYTTIDEHRLDKTQPYAIDLPSGKSITAFFYDGPLSQAVAFERLLRDGETFWQRLSGAAPAAHKEGLLSLATDGETYGHHFMFGEMALAHVIGQGIAARDDLRLTNYAAYLASHPPQMQVALHEPSSWSCVHGVERWRSNCGCTDGGHPEWHQEWRGPLRDALNEMKDAVDAHYDTMAPDLFCDAEKALLTYGTVLADQDTRDNFAAEHLRAGLAAEQTCTAWQLLAMQEHALSAFASCAWFFDDISRIEPVNGMTFALRAMQIMQETGGPDHTGTFEKNLLSAPSNIPKRKNGQHVFATMVRPRKETYASLLLQALLKLLAERKTPCPAATATVAWQGVEVAITPTDVTFGDFEGEAAVRWLPGSESETVHWSWSPPQPGHIREASCTVTLPSGEKITASYEELPRNKRQRLAAEFASVTGAQVLATVAPDAVNMVSLFETWEEGQHDQTMGEHWKLLAAPLAVALMRRRNITEERKRKLAQYLASNIGPGDKFLIEKWVKKRLQELIAGNHDDLAYAAQVVKTLRTIIPEANVWDAQNRLWTRGLREQEAKELAEALGFIV